MELTIIRHGKTDWNTEHRIQGHADIELNAEGLRETKELLHKIDSDFEIVYSSPLKRCLRAAEIIARHLGKELVVDNDLLERDFGSLDGKTWVEIIAATGNAEIRNIDHESEYDYRPYGGESAEQVKARVLKFLAEIKEKRYQKVLAMSHVGVIWMMYKLFPDYERLSASSASIHKFILNDD